MCLSMPAVAATADTPRMSAMLSLARVGTFVGGKLCKLILSPRQLRGPGVACGKPESCSSSPRASSPATEPAKPCLTARSTALPHAMPKRDFRSASCDIVSQHRISTGTTRVAPAAAGSSPSSSPSTSRIASVSTVKPPRSSRAISAVSRQETSARHERARQRYSVSCSQQLPNPCGPTYAKHKHRNRCRARERLDR